MPCIGQTSSEVIYVPENFSSIQSAIDSSSEVDSIFISSGVYYENLNFNGKNLVLIGESKETTIIDGSQMGGVITFNSGEESSVLIGLTIQNGLKEENENSVFPLDYSGAGIYVGNNSNITIIDCIIKNNYACDEGGGVFVNGSSVTISNTIINNNSSNSFGGGIWSGGKDCGLDTLPASLFLSNTIVSNNDSETGGGIYLCQNDNFNIDSTLIYNNHSLSESGGLYIAEGSGLVSNSSLINNVSYYGGQLFVGYDSNVEFKSGLIYFHDINYSSENIQSIFIEEDDVLEVSYSNIQGGIDGDFNIDLNPLLCPINNAIITLAENSPCIEIAENGGNIGGLEIGCSQISPVLGCTDNSANNFNSQATLNDNSCTYDIFGCTSSFAINYDYNANIDDWSCLYSSFTYDFLQNQNTDLHNININLNNTIDEATSSISSLQQALDTWNTTIDLAAGWNMFGYGCPDH